MNTFYLNISPHKGCGFANQFHIISRNLHELIQKQVRIVFLNKYLKSINTDDYCNISEIINIPETNKYLNKYNISLVDAYNYKLKINSIKYGDPKYVVDVTKLFVKTFYRDNSFNISTYYNINAICGDPSIILKKEYGVELNTNKQLFISYSIDNIVCEQSITVVNGLLNEPLCIDFNNIRFTTSIKYNDGSYIFYDILRNMVFTDTINIPVIKFIIENINSNDKINTFHLRLEDDAIEAWGKESKFDNLVEYKEVLETKYINLIQQYVQKTDLTMFLASNYDNNVIKYMKDNGYRFLLTPKFFNERDVSAIVDLLIGQQANNICVGVNESSFSYILINGVIHKPNSTCVEIYFTQPMSKSRIMDKKQFGF